MNDHWLPDQAKPARAILEPDMLVLAPPLGNFLVFSGMDRPLPEMTRVLTGSDRLGWQVVNWMHEGKHVALAKLSGPVRALGFALSVPGGALLEVAMAREISGSIAEVSTFLRKNDGPVNAVLKLVLSSLDLSNGVSKELLCLLQDGTEPEGFVELAALPETGGTYLQGWTQKPILGPCRVISAEGVFDADAAPFHRPDILAPASGLCLFAKNWGPGQVGGPVFVEAAGHISRLDPLSMPLAALSPAATEAHLRAMLPRLDAPGDTLGWFQRLCRPRFNGQDTLAGHAGPIAAHCDVVLRGENGGLFLAGWILDPMCEVKAALIKSTGNLYAPMDHRWHRMHRPDLNEGFADDPRFSGLLTPDNTLHGFLCHVPSPVELVDQAECYLELVLVDGDCLFLPLAPALCRDLDASKAALACVPQHDPAHLEVAKEHVVPFMATLPYRRRDHGAPLRCVGGSNLSKPVAALMAVQDTTQFVALLAHLSNTEDAAALDLVIALDDTVPPDTLGRLDSEFKFYNLTGAVALMRPQTTRSRRIDILRQGVTADLLLLWDPAVLPKREGWLGKLRDAHCAIGQAALVSPILSYEDGTVHFAGARLPAPTGEAVCAFAGIDRAQVSDLSAGPVAAGAAEFALVDRALLDQVGGVSGRLLGAAHCHHDLGLRLRQSGSSAWFSPAAELWVLNAVAAQQPDELPVIAEIDAALIDYLAFRGDPAPGGPSP